MRFTSKLKKLIRPRLKTDTKNYLEYIIKSFMNKTVAYSRKHMQLVLIQYKRHISKARFNVFNGRAFSAKNSINISFVKCMIATVFTSLRFCGSGQGSFVEMLNSIVDAKLLIYLFYILDSSNPWEKNWALIKKKKIFDRLYLYNTSITYLHYAKDFNFTISISDSKFTIISHRSYSENDWATAVFKKI